MSIDEESGGERPRATGWQTLACCALLVSPFLPLLAQAQEATPNDLATAISSGDAGVDLRYRFEHVDQDNIAKTASASTLRLRLNYATLPFRNIKGFVEFDYVAELLVDDFNSGGGTSPNRTQYPVVADPDGADLNQLYLDFGAIPDILLRLGRQRILLDNQRFVGGVGWRQNEQTYDGATLKWSGLEQTELQYSYVTRVNRIFGDSSPAGRDDSNTHLLNARFMLPETWTLSAYAYRIDDDDVSAFSTLTVGARLNGSIPAGERKMTLTGEIASQSDAASAPVDYRATYYRFDAAIAVTDMLSLGLGYESLGGDQTAAGKAFRTPLATLHAFQGWADVFLNTPDAGIDDLFATVSVKQGNWAFAGTWHQFSAADGGADWGSEIDVSASRKLGERYGLLLKAAAFNADNAAFADTRKLWLMLTAAY
ncbi:MAG: alginate export family protein [Woeseia sp.]